MTDYHFLESIKNLSIEEQNTKLIQYINYIQDEYSRDLLFLQSQISKYSNLYSECQEQLYKN